MSKNRYGLIHDYYPRDRIISILKRGRIVFYYFSKKYDLYFKQAMSHRPAFVSFKSSHKIKYLKNYPVYQITEIESIYYSSRRGIQEVYSSFSGKEELESIINQKSYKMFMDLELTMPKYGETKAFTPEILQIGCVILDEKDEIVNYYSKYIKTNNPISDRTYRFLQLDSDATEEAIPYNQFYKEYSHLLKIYNPVIYTWGIDKLYLENSYKLHNLPTIGGNYQDLSHIITKYFRISEDIALFKALSIFRGINAKQAHHALTDAQATKEIYDTLKKCMAGEIIINLQEELIKFKRKQEEDN